MDTGTLGTPGVHQAHAWNYTKYHMGRGVMKTPVVMATIMFVKNRYENYLTEYVYFHISIVG